MTNKVQTIIAGIVASISSFWSWILSMPPEMQTQTLQPFVELTPLDWRPALGLFMRTLASVSTLYAVFRASQSGPGTPPKNPVNA